MHGCVSMWFMANRLWWAYWNLSIVYIFRGKTRLTRSFYIYFIYEPFLPCGFFRLITFLIRVSKSQSKKASQAFLFMAVYEQSNAFNNLTSNLSSPNLTNHQLCCDLSNIWRDQKATVDANANILEATPQNKKGPVKTATWLASSDEVPLCQTPLGATWQDPGTYDVTDSPG